LFWEALLGGSNAIRFRRSDGDDNPYNVFTMRSATVVIAFFCFVSSLALGQTLQIGELPPLGAVADQEYSLPLTATGGASPYIWQVISGSLPPGLKLHSHSGKISGVPTTPGEYYFTIGVTDGSVPKLRARRELAIHVISGLTVEWKEAPTAHGNRISGSLEVSNETPHKLDLTVIVVAVNDIGRATALGYQHFTLEGEATSQVIPFSATPGLGTYYVRADAVAHHTGHQRIFRAAQQTLATIKVMQF
jgi:Putative Ig domain